MNSYKRERRFKVKTSEQLLLKFTYHDAKTSTEQQIELRVVDVSTHGLAAETSPRNLGSLRSKEIVHQATLSTKSMKIDLGRLVLIRLDNENDIIKIGFGTVDTKVPIEGELSRILVNDSPDGIFQDTELISSPVNLTHFTRKEYKNSDLFYRLKEFKVFFDDLKRSDKFGHGLVRKKSHGKRVTLDRTRPDGREDYVVMSSNDYFGLASHPQVLDKVAQTVRDYGFGSTGSPVTTGTTDLHVWLTQSLSSIFRKEASILYNSGYAANVGVIPSLTRSGDLILADQLCHASIQDGIQMSKADVTYFKHNDVAHLREMLKMLRENYGGCLIITEGVFSMDGDSCRLDEITSLAREFNCRVMVDEAHSFGILGPQGLGVCEKYNLFDKVDIVMGTFSKICGGIGGFISGRQELIDWLFLMSRAHVFSVSLPPSTVAGVQEALNIFRSEPKLLQDLRNNIRHFTSGLKALGHKGLDHHESAVVPIIVSDEEKLGTVFQELLNRGVLTTLVGYPAVSQSSSRLRLTISSQHSISDLDYVLNCIEIAQKKAGFVPGEKPTESGSAVPANRSDILKKVG